MTITKTVVTALFWFSFALLIAAVEIESEGKWGWAEKAPTWYRVDGVAAKIYGALMSGKPLTGYHLVMFIFPLFIFHIPFFAGVQWTVKRELMACAMYFAWCPLWDFLWFVLNPHYGIANFSKANVWWHAKSIWVAGLFPVDYLVAWIVSVGFAATSCKVGEKDWTPLKHHGITMGLFLIFTFASFVTVAPLYKRYYKTMRERDDRPKAPIFHTLPQTIPDILGKKE
jgi:hypothetical protein